MRVVIFPMLACIRKNHTKTLGDQFLFWVKPNDQIVVLTFANVAGKLTPESDF